MDAKQQHAADLLAVAIETTLETGLYKCAQLVVSSAPVGGRKEDVTCIVFADSSEVARYMQQRICTPTQAELDVATAVSRFINASA